MAIFQILGQGMPTRGAPWEGTGAVVDGMSGRDGSLVHTQSFDEARECLRQCGVLVKEKQDYERMTHFLQRRGQPKAHLHLSAPPTGISQQLPRTSTRSSYHRSCLEKPSLHSWRGIGMSKRLGETRGRPFRETLYFPLTAQESFIFLVSTWGQTPTTLTSPKTLDIISYRL